MKSALREYGLIAVVIAAAMVGYLFYNYNKEAVIDYALDTIGERLVQLLDNESSRDAVRQRFAQLRGRILDEDVDPEAVEQLAANVLNLSAAGESITADEADMVLREAMEWRATSESAAAPEAGSVSSAPLTSIRVKLERLGTEVVAVAEAEDEFKRLAKEHEAAAPLPPFVVTASDAGLRVRIDSIMVGVFAEGGELPQSIRELQKHKMLVWEKQLAKKRAMSHEKAAVELEHVRKHLEKAMQVQRQAIASAEAAEEVSSKAYEYEVSVSLTPEILDRIRVLKELETKGVWIQGVPDSLVQIVIREPETVDVVMDSAVDGS